MKTKRNLSGVYFRVENSEGKFENVCIEDLTRDQQKEVIKGKNEEWIHNLIFILADSLNEVGDEFDIIKKYE